MFQSIIIIGCVLLTLQIHSTICMDLGDLDTLGDRITASVNRDLEPLKDLGPRIEESVNKRLRKMFRSSGRDFSTQLQHDLEPLNHLGEQINQSVNEGLEPVRALEVYLRMKEGTGGITIIKHSPSGRQFIVQNRQRYECTGAISPTGVCSGQLIPFTRKSNQDYCYFRNNYSIVNNLVCVDSTTVNVYNGKVQCINSVGNPVLQMNIHDYNRMCKAVSAYTEYKYIADMSNPLHVHIPNKNKHVVCLNNEKNVCVFEETFDNMQNNQIIMNIEK